MNAQLFGTQRINAKGHLEVGGVDTVDLAERYGTPAYVIDEDGLRARCREYVRAFTSRAPGAIVSFATKAFLCKAAARLAVEERLHIDVASHGELSLALAAGVPPEHVTLHGNYKKDEDIEAGVAARVGVFALDSLLEAEAVSRISVARGHRQRAILRVAPGIDGHTLDAISTGRNDTKFGVTVESGAASRAIEAIRALPGVELIGLHAHIGSQILSLDPFALLVETISRWIGQVRAATGWAPELLVLGGGLGIRYTPDAVPPSVEDLAETMTKGLERAAKAHGFPLPRLGIEPGRSLVGEAGLTLYRIGPVKEVPAGDNETRTYAVVDGGLSDNPRPLMYGARYPVLLGNRAAEEPGPVVRVAGRHCETDTLFDVALPRPRTGDLLAVLCTGAYNHTMASNYNFFCRPPVIFVRKGKARVVVRRETVSDLLLREVDA